MPEVSKAQKRHLRDLAARAYDRELSAALEELHRHFQRWKAEEIAAWDLNELIHKHHNGISRELYNMYTGSDSLMPVARALARQFLSWEEVRDDCRPLLSRMVDFFSSEDTNDNEG
jgi:hypothetical protein